MRLNHDCIRDLLLAAEETLSYGIFLDINKTQIKSYSAEELVYTADKLIEGGFLKGTVQRTMSQNPPRVRVLDITWDGHQFLETVRDDTTWNKVISIARTIGVGSLKNITAIAEGIATTAIKQHLGLP